MKISRVAHTFIKSRPFRVVLYLFLATVLIFTPLYLADSPMLGAAYADENGTEQSDDPEPPPAPVLKINDVGIFFANTDIALGYASNSSDQVRGEISARGGSLQFDSVITWTDWSKNRNHNLVVWSVDDPSIASITTNTGLLSAHADGTVKVMATVKAADTSTGVDLVAYTFIKVTGQSDARYVESITITDVNGTALGSVITWTPDLTTNVMQFRAQIVVCNPADNTRQTYSTLNGLLSSQASDLSNLEWRVNETSMAEIDPEYGDFRPKVHGGVFVYVSSNAGVSGAIVSAQITVQSDPKDGYTPDEFQPQDSLTIRAYYEEYTPDEYGDAAYVVNKTYSVDDVESFGTVIQSYTALGGTSAYATYTGRGSAFSTLLEDAGVSLDKSSHFMIASFDGVERVSRAEVFDYDRYYYPNIDIGSYAGAIQVYPIIALESNRLDGGSAQPNYEMSIGTRFRLLYGANPNLGTGYRSARYSIYQIDVVLYGAPTANPGDNNGPGGSKDPGDGSGGDGLGGENQSSNGEGDNQTGDDTPGSAAIITDDGIGNREPDQASNLTVENIGNISSLQEVGSDLPAEMAERGTESPANYFVYSMMSKNDNKDEKPLDIYNPLEPFAIPLGASVLIAGGAEMLLWYRRQSQMTIVSQVIGT